MFEKEAEEYTYFVKSTKERWKCDKIFYADIELAYQKGAEFGYNKANEKFKICEQNADTYYDQLQKAKRIIQEFLDLNYSEFTKTNAVFLHADKFLKES